MAVRNIQLLLCLYAGVFSASGLTIQFEELAKSYDSTERPTQRGASVVNISLHISTLEVDDVRQVLRMSGEMQQEWDDINLRYPSSSNQYSSIGLEGRRGDRIKQFIWLPDIAIADGLYPSSSAPVRDFLKIKNDGHMTWTQQIFFEFPCEFDYADYPLGEQRCDLKLQSIGYDIEEVEPRWSSGYAVEYGSTIVSLLYSIDDVEISTSTVVINRITKNQLQATLVLKSVTGWPVKHTVLPFVAAVATAYLAFFVNVTGVTARMIIGGVSLVIAAIFHESTYSKAPQADYTMAIEVFTGTCMTFIWVSIAESVIVDILSHLRANASSTATHNSFSVEHSEVLTLPTSRGQIAALWLDRCFRVLYPAVFISFNAVYWIFYH